MNISRPFFFKIKNNDYIEPTNGELVFLRDDIGNYVTGRQKSSVSGGPKWKLNVQQLWNLLWEILYTL